MYASTAAAEVSSNLLPAPTIFGPYRYSLANVSHKHLNHLHSLQQLSNIWQLSRRFIGRMSCHVRASCTSGSMAPAQSLQGDGEEQLISSEFLLPRQALSYNGGPHRTAAQALHLIVLNWALPRCFPDMWHQAVVRVCADGGANRLYDELPKVFPAEAPDDLRRRFLPDVIHGDLDSLREDVRTFYLQHGVKLHESEDQDTTDLTKCVTFIEQRFGSTLSAPTSTCAVQAEQTENGNGQQNSHSHGLIVALGGVGGRLDHTLANLNTLHMFRHLPLALLGEGNLVRLVRAGKCRIRPALAVEGPTCGLVPMMGTATVRMSGFRWNLEGEPMQVGGLISTSNIIDSEELHVQTDKDLIWTTELRGSCGQ